MSLPDRTFVFGPFRLAPEERAVYREGVLVPLTPRCFDLLRELVVARGRVLTKERLLSSVWADAVVEEGSLTRTVSILRAALGPEGETLIETLPRIGYRLAADVVSGAGETPKPVARLVWHERDREYRLELGENLVGRDPEASVWIDHESVSRRHARVIVSETGAVVEDLGSKNGTYFGKERLRDPARLADGDLVSFGVVALVFRRPSAASTVTARVS